MSPDIIWFGNAPVGHFKLLSRSLHSVTIGRADDVVNGPCARGGSGEGGSSLPARVGASDARLGKAGTANSRAWTQPVRARTGSSVCIMELTVPCARLQQSPHWKSSRSLIAPARQVRTIVVRRTVLAHFVSPVRVGQRESPKRGYLPTELCRRADLHNLRLEVGHVEDAPLVPAKMVLRRF